MMAKLTGVREVTPALGATIDRYRARFRGDPNDEFSLFETRLSDAALITRLNRAIREGKPYDAKVEEWSVEFRAAVDRGELII